MLHVLRRCCAPLLLCAVLGFTLVGCGGSSGGSGGTGRLAVYLVDAPDPNVSAVNITIDKVEAHVNGSWLTVVPTPTTLDLLDVQRVALLLGTADLPAGHYTQVRLFVSNPSVTVDGVTTPIPLDIPSGDQTGIKVNIDGDISADHQTAVLLDFNVNESLVRTGNNQYKLKPVIRATLLAVSASISGNVVRVVDGNNKPVVGASVTAVYTAGGHYATGTVVGSGFTADDDTAAQTTAGSFKIWGLLPGTYRLNVTWTDTTTTPATAYAGTLEGVSVTEGQALALANPIIIAPVPASP